MTNDLISRQAAKKAVCSMCRWEGTSNCDECEHPIDELPAIDSVKHGKWIEIKDGLWWKNYYCSECRTEFMVDTCMLKPMWKFCPECGARMDLK